MKTENITVYTKVLIRPHHSGFGMWERGEVHTSPENSFAFAGDLIQAIYNSSDYVLPIGQALADAEFIALGVEDIRGKIYNQPSKVFARIYRDTLTYFGIVESEVPANFYKKTMKSNPLTNQYVMERMGSGASDGEAMLFIEILASRGITTEAQLSEMDDSEFLELLPSR